MSENVGFIGLGLLGLPMVTNLAAAGYHLTVYNRTPSKAAPLVAQGATLATAAIEVAKPGGIVVSSLWDGPVVDSIVTSEFLDRLKGGLHISTTTMLPATSRELAARHADHGVGFVEAPVFGRPEAAAAKQLAIPYAGASRDKERAKPYLAALGAPHVFDLGESFGAALATKLAGNFMLITAARTFAEALEMAEHAGADRKLVVEMLTSTLFSAPIYKTYGQRLVERQPSFVSQIPAKDLGLFVATAKGETPIADLIRSLL